MSVKHKKAPDTIILQWTHVHPIDPKECGKTFELGENGELICESIPHLNKSEMTLMTGASLNDFVDYLNDVDTGYATIYGIPRDLDKLDEEKTVNAYSRTAFSKLQDHLKAHAITRTLKEIAYPDGPGIMLLDYDPASGDVPLTEGDLIGMVMSATSGAGQVKVISGSSSSSHIINSETDEVLKGESGRRIYIMVADAADIKRAGKVLFKRLWLAGHGSIMISSSGSWLTRAPIDRAVWDDTRLDFTGGAICRAPLIQKRPPFTIIGNDGDAEILDTWVALPDLTAAKEAEYARLVAQAKESVAEDAAAVREQWIEARLEDAAKAGLPQGQRSDRKAIKAAVEALRATPLPERLRRASENDDGGRLPGDMVLTVRAEGKPVSVTVREVLCNPETWHDAICLDPMEPDYNGGRWVGRIHAYGAPNVFSFAHGGVTYMLGSADEWTDLQQLRSNGLNRAYSKIMKAHKDVMSEPMMSLARSLRQKANEGDAEAEARLEEIGKIAKADKVKTSWSKAVDREDEEQPSEDDAKPEEERRPVIVYRQKHDENTVSADIARAFAKHHRMFNNQGRPVVIENKPTVTTDKETGEVVYQLAIQEAVPGDYVIACSETVRLFAPSYNGKPKEATLHGSLLHAVSRQTALLPAVIGLIHTPTLTASGDLIFGRRGYDPELHMVVDTPEITLRDWPNPETALRFLLEEWWHEFPFKTPEDALRALLLPMTILGRAMIMDDVGPPAFLVTAPELESGKSCLVDSAMIATSGRNMASATFTSNTEEMRKILTTAAAEQPPALVFDNVDTGWDIRGGPLDAFITSNTFQGRKLGESQTITANVTFPIVLNGNNITAVGDTLTRVVHVRMEQPDDPKPFTGDPLQFARENPGEILGAMATILRSRAGDDIKRVSRFPGWERKIALPLMDVAGAPQLLDHFRVAKEEHAKSLRYYDELEELAGKMHQHALKHGFYDAETRTAWFAVRELRDEFYSCIRALFPEGRLPAVQGIVGKMRKFEGRKIGSHRFRVAKRLLGGRTNFKETYCVGIEVRDTTRPEDVEVAAPSCHDYTGLHVLSEAQSTKPSALS